MDLSQIPPGLERPNGIPARLGFASHEDAREHRKKMLVAAFRLRVCSSFSRYCKKFKGKSRIFMQNNDFCKDSLINQF